MIRVGAHVSIAGGPQMAPVRAQELGATALGMFTKNQRQWTAKPLLPEQIAEFKENLTTSGIRPEHVVIHGSYLINIAGPDPEKRERSLQALLDEAQRAEQLGLKLVNFHPGSGLNQLSEEQAIRNVADGCLRVLEETEHAVLVLESTAGQGAHIGHTFEHLYQIMDAAGGHERIQVCVDTCHLFAAGYDLRTPENYNSVIEQFDKIVGLKHLVGVHLNDSMSECGSRKDRHESIGNGQIGLAGLAEWVKDARLAEVPFVLETIRPELWKDEIALLQQLADGLAPDQAVIPAQASSTADSADNQ